MSNYEFSVVDIFAEPYAAAPQLTARLRIQESTGQTIHAIALRCQVRIEPHRRRYDDEEAAGLVDLFGTRSRWAQTLKPLQLANLTQVVPTFSGATEVTLALPCSYDFDVAAHKYLYALQDGIVPLLLLFSGTCFVNRPEGLAVLPVPWDREASYGLPVAVWREAMEQHFPGSAWLRLGRDTFDALYRYRSGNALLSWDEAVRRLLKEAGQ